MDLILTSLAYASTDSIEEIDKKKVREAINNALKDEEIPENWKKYFRCVRDKGALDNFAGAAEQRKLERLRASIIDKCQHPIYSKIKGKLPFILFTPPTFNELTRLATYRAAGFASAPLTLGAIIGFSMPCAVTFSMLEMYAPDKFKFPCKCMKWAGGAAFFGVCEAMDYYTAGAEKKHFGKEMPINAPELMGTLPTSADVDGMQKLAQSLMKKTPLSDTAKTDL